MHEETSAVSVDTFLYVLRHVVKAKLLPGKHHR